MRALVTGVAGLVGSHLADELLRLGWDVVGVDDLSGGDIRNVDPAVDAYYNDFASEPILRMVRQGTFDVVFHQAARPRVAYSVDHMAETEDHNVLRSLRLFEACVGHVGRVIFASSSSVYGGDTFQGESTIPNPQSPYALQKLTLERYAAQLRMHKKLDIVGLRYFNVYGPRAVANGSPYMTALASWLEALHSGGQLRMDGDGEQSRDLTYVGDVVCANVLAHQCAADFSDTERPVAYNVGTGESWTNNEVMGMLRSRFDVPDSRIVRAPERPGDVRRTRASTIRAERDLRFKAQVDLVAGLDMTIEWWKGYGSKWSRQP